MPRTEEQYKEIREKSRNLIIQTALKLFALKGYHGTSIADIAKEAGISKGLAYNYFKSKSDLIEVVLEQLGVEVNQMFAGIESISDPYEKLRLFIEGTLDSIKNDEEFWSLYFGLSLQHDVLEISKKVLGNIIEQTFGLIETLFIEIGVKDAKAEARIFGAILDGVGVHYVYDKKNYPLEKVKQQLIKKYSRDGLASLTI